MDGQGRFYLVAGSHAPFRAISNFEPRVQVRDLLISSTPCLRVLSIQPPFLSDAGSLRNGIYL